jgi:HSP90 family molecular chaperone
MADENTFKFAISLSVLNHLGRNLYRNFITVLGEAISNAWDADARNVWIDFDKEHAFFSIKDDGVGMDPGDFQGKFLKIGYSKRKDGQTETGRGRPFIGAKGIGKLALLSCAERVTIFSRKEGGNYTGGVIDKSGHDEAITDNLNQDE